ncbi:MAG: hypothetical protein ATN35_02825 [Epulopiscium sp. Nele67-Bin004]|nr:MAG: hypothetical protein ATN35_02825 [Epulopiscium sp. Nele67-Bin004]
MRRKYNMYYKSNNDKKAKIAANLLAVALVTTSASAHPISANSEVEAILNFTTGLVTLNGTDIATTSMPYISSTGRSMVGVRDLAMFLGIDDDHIVFDDGEVAIRYDDTTLMLSSGDKYIWFDNGEFIAMDEPMQIVDGRSYAPISYIAAALDLDVSFDEITKEATFSNK